MQPVLALPFSCGPEQLARTQAPSEILGFSLSASTPDESARVSSKTFRLSPGTFWV